MDTDKTPAAMPETPSAEAEQPLLITADMLVPARPKDPRVPFEKGMSYFPLLVVLLLLANIAVYLWEVATGVLLSQESVIAAGALYRDKVLAGEVWRLVSAAFLHGGFDHILGNAIFLYILGLGTEHAFGLGKTAVIYLFAAVTGSLLSLAMQPGPGVGASGAIFGLMGALAVLFHRRRADFYLRDRGIGLFVGAVAIYQIGTGFFTPFIDNWAHLGGFLGGALAALVLRPSLGEESRTLPVAGKALLAAAFALFAGGWLYLGGYLAAAEAHAWIYYGDKPAAVAAATDALAKNPANAYMYYLRGTLLLDAGQPAAAIKDLDRYLETNGDNHRAQFAVANAYYDRGQYQEALTHYSRAVALAPRDIHYLNGRGYTYILTGQYAAARADFTAILEIDASFASAWGNLGLVHAYEGDYTVAIGKLEQAYSMDKTQAPLKYLVAGIRAEVLGQRAKAIENYGRFTGEVAQERSTWQAEINFAEARAAALRSRGK
ncbi:rhomboid family intramembrane serine protease [Anaeroselena agilis]|uniref:Rhomboid family intramembrane serine protease n=1 Tax=Anaeroselena agilis TaxID=3063788 RepID=A0ABU3P1E9_9FIRM|nr:rhomboid family intramembrane serine protease [Selenomonadales bacterium 4137-cl]